MKSVISSVLVLFAIIFAFDSRANDLVYQLNCKWDLGGRAPVGAPRYQVVKTVSKDARGKWITRYSIRQQPLSPNAKVVSFELKSAQSGDDDSNEYDVVDPNHQSAIKKAYIQNRFDWASLTDLEETISYDCRKSYR